MAFGQGKNLLQCPFIDTAILANAPQLVLVRRAAMFADAAQ
jgi:hypothetical protein